MILFFPIGMLGSTGLSCHCLVTYGTYQGFTEIVNEPLQWGSHLALHERYRSPHPSYYIHLLHPSTSLNTAETITVTSRAHHGDSNHRQLNWLPNHLFWLTIKYTPQIYITGPLWIPLKFDHLISLTCRSMNNKLCYIGYILFHHTRPLEQHKKIHINLFSIPCDSPSS